MRYRVSMLAALLMLAAGGQALAAETVPFVGCGGISKQGSGVIDAPQGKPLVVQMPATIARRLALYADNWSAVLAPRGWKCADLETSETATLYVWPAEGAGDPMAGPIVSVTRLAPVDAYAIDKTYFPAVFLKLDTAPVTTTAMLRYPDDVIDPGGARWFSYRTPAGRPGLGNNGVPQGLPADGAIAYSFGSAKSSAGILWLNIRLPAAMADLQPRIAGYFQRCLPDDNTLDCESGGALLRAGNEFDGD